MRTTKPTSARNAAIPTRKILGEVRRRISGSDDMDCRTGVHRERGYPHPITIASLLTLRLASQPNSWAFNRTMFDTAPRALLRPGQSWLALGQRIEQRSLGGAPGCDPLRRRACAYVDNRRKLRPRRDAKSKEVPAALRLAQASRVGAYAAFAFGFSQPRLASTSAICTAFSAAPFRRLSDTHQRLSPFSIVGSSRMRLM